MYNISGDDDDNDDDDDMLFCDCARCRALRLMILVTLSKAAKMTPSTGSCTDAVGTRTVMCVRQRLSWSTCCRNGRRPARVVAHQPCLTALDYWRHDI